MNIIAQFIAAFFLSSIIAIIAAPPNDVETVATITFLLTALLIYSRHKGKKPKETDKEYQKLTKENYPPNLYSWPSLMEFEFEVVGESYYQPALAKLAVDHARISAGADEIKPLTAHLIPDDYNEYDDKAVRVEINGLHVGYLSREDARSFRRRLGAKKLTGQITTCGALITGGHVKDGKKMSYGVVLDIQPFE